MENFYSTARFPLRIERRAVRKSTSKGGAMKKMIALLLFVSCSAWAQTPAEVEEFDPFAPDALETLAEFDQVYRAETGENTMFDFADPFAAFRQVIGGCSRGECHVFANVVKATQTL